MDADAYTPDNAAIAIQRLEPVSAAPDEESARLFVHPEAPARLLGVFRPV
jgi:hypothetical protein